MTRTSIGGPCDWTAASTHRPSDPDELRAVALDLRGRGLTARDIAEALKITEAAVSALLESRPVETAATCPRTGIPTKLCTCVGPHDHD